MGLTAGRDTTCAPAQKKCLRNASVCEASKTRRFAEDALAAAKNAENSPKMRRCDVWVVRTEGAFGVPRCDRPVEDALAAAKMRPIAPRCDRIPQDAIETPKVRVTHEDATPVLEDASKVSSADAKILEKSPKMSKIRAGSVSRDVHHLRLF